MIGGCTVEELQSRMNPREFREWMAWASIRGMFGEQRADLRNGILCSLLVNLATAFAGKTSKAKPSDYMPFYKMPPADPEKQADIKAQIENLQDVLGVKEG